MPKRKDPNVVTEKAMAFLAAYRTCGFIGAACVAAKCDRKSPDYWRKNSTKFAELFDEARQDAIEMLEVEAVRRAKDGYSKVILHDGAPVFVWVDPEGNIVRPNTEGAKEVALREHKYSDTLLIFTLKALNPQKYRDSVSIDHTTKGMPIYKEIAGVSMDDL